MRVTDDINFCQIIQEMFENALDNFLYYYSHLRIMFYSANMSTVLFQCVKTRPTRVAIVLFRRHPCLPRDKKEKKKDFNRIQEAIHPKKVFFFRQVSLFKDRLWYFFFFFSAKAK